MDENNAKDGVKSEERPGGWAPLGLRAGPPLSTDRVREPGRRAAGAWHGGGPEGRDPRCPGLQRLNIP